MFYGILYVSLLVFTFAATAVILRFLIPYLKSKKLGQKILDIGPRWHKSKEGTPMMGGLAFVIASSVGTFGAVLAVWLAGGETADILPLVAVLGYGILNSLIGFIDDRAKLLKQQNEGLTAPQKYLLQLVAAALFLLFLRLSGTVSTAIYIPFVGVELELGFFFYIVALLLLTGVVNSVNLTDGIDGLASSVTLVIGIFFSLAAFFAMRQTLSFVPLALLGALLIGSTVGFLVYNFYPARIFMGDTGSLFLGGMVVGAVFVIGNPLLIVVAGIVYMIEAASVILQVGYFKLTHGKRLFRMAPIHHHFEKCGFSEVRIVALFSAVTAVFCALAWFGLRV